MLNISRQAFHKNRRHIATKQLQEEIVIQLVNEIRYKLHRLGGRKLYYMLKDDLQRLQSKLGRDKFFDILRENGLLVKPTKQYKVTTNSHHRFRIYLNLVKNITISRPNMVFVADVTYIRLNRGFCFLFLVTDVYSRKIVGYALGKSLAADGTIAAIKMALSGLQSAEGLIHHSDRGIQYCCDDYVSILHQNGVQISMGEIGNPYDNAIAERVNGILKTEFFLSSTFASFQHANQAVVEAVNMYNELRPHMSIGYMTPSRKYIT